jgi:16S rRNA (cytosine1402-N4)-methyltransferase
MKPNGMDGYTDMNGSLGSDYHVPVLWAESIDGLAIKSDGVYVDCTMGGGGHTRGILSRLGPNGKLFAFDQDADAVKNLPNDPRLVFIPQNFRHIHRFLRLHHVKEIDGLLADLGVSSHQFDEAGRGFSIRFDAKLDMRMDVKQLKTAAQVVQTYSETNLQNIFSTYGEVTNAKTLAKCIVHQRSLMPLETIESFKSAIHDVVMGNPNKYLAKVFQALRIEVNDELNALKDLLDQSNSLVKSGGRIAIITFHSLEDRVVKQFIRSGTNHEEEVEKDLFGNKQDSPWKLVNKKPIESTEIEKKQNPRSRSARLRVAEKK